MSVSRSAMESHPGRAVRALWSGRFSVLFWLLLATIAIPVVVPDGPIIRRTMAGLLFVAMLSGLNTISDHRRQLVVGLCLSLPAVALNWIGLGLASFPLYAASQYLYMAFFLYLAVLTIRWANQQRKVDQETIYGAVSVYLLMALVWSLAYYAIALSDPGAFRFPDRDELGAVQANRVEAVGGGEELRAAPGWEEISEVAQGTMMYYSFVTITTLGYGDIYPVSDAARILAMLEAVLGQLFLVILVARLVGLYTSQLSGGRAEPPT